jgi:hypothetical protein
MSARIVAVTSLLIDVLADLDSKEELTPSEGALVDLLWVQMEDLVRISALARREMQALPALVLAR